MANITAACPVCGEVFTRPCKPRADGRYFCSRACAGAWRKSHPICAGKRRDRAFRSVRQLPGKGLRGKAYDLRGVHSVPSLRGRVQKEQG